MRNITVAAIQMQCSKIVEENIDKAEKMVREAAAEGMVLLKNSGNLPMEAKGNIALFGLSAYKSIAGGTGSGNVNKPYIRNISEGLEAAGFTLDSRLTDFYA